MAIEFRCPLCEAPFRVNDKLAGKKARCNKCGGSIVIPQIVPEFKLAVGHQAAFRPDASRPMSVAERQERVVGAFQSDLPPNRVPLVYRLSVALVAVVMVLLPILYLAFIVLIGVGVVYHLTHHTGMLQVVRGKAAILAFIIYLAPVVIGVIAIVFSMLLGGDLTLTIGVPLVAGLTTRQFAGVLAHEFGHFRQGAGMRVSYVVRSISFWFTRVVYERDEWDVWLEHVTDDMDIRIAWVFFVARGFVWLGRRVLWVLMIVGHAVAGVLLRQMEFDADRQQARLTGSDSFERTMYRIHELSIANEKSVVDLLSLLSQGALGDNLPKLVMFNAVTMPANIKSKIREGVAESTTGLFDTHPCAKDRMEATKREQAPGVFQLDGPASELFVHFEPLCKNITWDFYRDVTNVHIQPDKLESMDALLGRLQTSWS